MGESEAAELLQQTLAEEKEADEALTGVAESSINLEANEEEEEEEETAAKSNGNGKLAKPSRASA